MKLLSAILVLLSISCHGQTNNKILGSWYHCTRDGTYEELHFQQEYFRSFFGDLEGFTGDRILYYQLIKDSIKYALHPLDLKNPQSTRLVTILFTDQNTMVPRIKSKIDTLHRLNIVYQPQPSSKSIEVATNWYNQFEEGFMKRLAQKSCPDKRTASERLADTVKVDLGIITEDIEDVYYPDSTRHDR